MEPDSLAVGIDLLLRDVDGIEGVGASGVAQLPDERGELVVCCFFIHDEGEAGVAVVEDFEGCRRDGGARGISDGGAVVGDAVAVQAVRRGFAAGEQKESRCSSEGCRTSCLRIAAEF